MLRRAQAALAAFALFAASSLAAASAAGEIAPPSPFEAKTATPPMWRVTDKDSTVYLLGTFHILPAGLDWRPDYVNAAIERADSIWFEAEVDTPGAKQKTTQILMTEGFNKKGDTLTGLLGDKDAALLRKVAGEVGLPMSAIDSMRPWYAFLAISVQFIVSRGFDPDSGVETVLMREARDMRKSMHFFETVEQQLGLFTSLPPETEKRLLTATLEEWDQQTADLGKLYAAWRTGDADAIDALMNQPMRADAPKVFNILVTDRNERWADEIAKDMRSGAGVSLVAVGAGHLVGANSVPALLAAKGFKVERYGADSAPQ